MSGRPNTKWKETMLNKFDGDEELLRRHLQSIGSKGGRNGHTGGFAANPELARRAGAKGGRISRRRPKVV